MTNKDIDLNDLGLGDEFDPKRAAKAAPPRLSQMEIEAANAESNRAKQAIQDNVLARQERIRTQEAKRAQERIVQKIVETILGILWGLPLSYGLYLLFYYYVYDITVLDESSGDRFVNQHLANNRICGLIVGGALFIAGTIKANLTHLLDRLTEARRNG